MPYEKLERLAFRFADCRDADRRYFLIQIGRYVQSDHLHRVAFFRFIRHHIWLRNERGKTIKYLHFSEYHQSLGLCMYFKNWALQALEKVEEASKQLINKRQKQKQK